jgi:hypothetical protein
MTNITGRKGYLARQFRGESADSAAGLCKNGPFI